MELRHQERVGIGGSQKQFSWSVEERLKVKEEMSSCTRTHRFLWPSRKKKSRRREKKKKQKGKEVDLYKAGFVSLEFQMLEGARIRAVTDMKLE
jgi:hypothetical protein